MGRGERLNKSGNSWFSPKAIEVAPRVLTLGGRALLWLGGRLALPNHGKLRIPRSYKHGRQTAGANVRRQEGNNPDRQLRSPRHS